MKKFNAFALGAVASLTCYFLWNTTVKRLGTVRTTNYIYFIPIVTLIASVIALTDEKITFVALIGGGVDFGRSGLGGMEKVLKIV